MDWNVTMGYSIAGQDLALFVLSSFILLIPLAKAFVFKSYITS